MSKILLFDIETSPNIGFTWGKWEQNVIEFVEDWHMLSFAYKWLDEKTTHVVSLPDFKLYSKDKSNDKELVKELWKLFDEADAIIAHNGTKFDIKKSNTRFIQHGLTPPSPYKVIDTLTIAKKYFKFDSNKLDDLGKYLGVGRKIDTGGFELWKGCMSGDMLSWRRMCLYNKQDVILLEKIYLKMRNWITNHPNLSVLDGRNGTCNSCGSAKLQKRGFGIRGGGTKVQRMNCQSCGAWLQVTIIKTMPTVSVSSDT